jgi:clan AA aspartic protease
MGKIFAKIVITNSRDTFKYDDGLISKEDVRSMSLNILVDTGAYNLALNERIATQLGLKKMGEQTFILADGSEQLYDIVGPVEIKFENRETTTRAVLLPGNVEPLLGQIPLEDMDVILLPKEEKMIVNPMSPYIARKDLK